MKKDRFRSALRGLRARPRLMISVAIGVLGFFLSPHYWRTETRALVAWDVAISFYLVFVFRLAQSSEADHIRGRARRQDDGAVMTLAFSTAAAVACFVAITLELASVKSMVGSNRVLHTLLVAATIPMAWAFIHSMFALHYAHAYYDQRRPDAPGLAFPGSVPPTYWDFLYFSFILGTSGQTADVSITSPRLRRTALVHCVMAFFFNITMLGLGINVASSLL